MLIAEESERQFAFPRDICLQGRYPMCLPSRHNELDPRMRKVTDFRSKRDMHYKTGAKMVSRVFAGLSGRLTDSESQHFLVVFQGCCQG